MRVKLLCQTVQHEIRASNISDNSVTDSAKAWRNLANILKLKSHDSECTLAAEELNVFHNRFDTNFLYLRRLLVILD